MNAQSLKNLIKLTEQRDSLQSELTKVESQISSLLGGKTSKPSESKVKPTDRARRGTIKTAILDTLKKAGPKGVSVIDLSSKLGVKNSSLHVWFATTGKSVAGLRKIGPGHYALS